MAPGRTEKSDATREQQVGINRAEVDGAPVSRLRLWRSFFGWVLSLAFLWELVRNIIVHYWPASDLPPSMLKEIITLLFGMLGLGV